MKKFNHGNKKVEVCIYEKNFSKPITGTDSGGKPIIIGYKDNVLTVLTRGPLDVGDIIENIVGSLDQKCIKMINRKKSKSTWKDGIVTTASFTGIITDNLREKYNIIS